MDAPFDMEGPLEPALEQGICPHLAILLDSFDEVPSALASFYALGLRRNGWIFHRALPGEAEQDRAALVAAGLDIGPLEAEERFELCELPVTDPPETWAEPYLPVLEEKLERGFDAVWWSRFPIGPDEEVYRLALEYDRHWEACFHGRKAVSLCVYIVGGLPDATRSERMRELGGVHDALLVGDGGGLTAVTRES